MLSLDLAVNAIVGRLLLGALLADPERIQLASKCFLTTAGHPTTSTSDGTSEITAAPAPITARAPI